MTALMTLMIDRAEAHLDRFRFGPPACHLMELGHEGMVGMPVDQGDFHLGVLAEPFLEDLARPDATIASAKDEYPFLPSHCLSPSGSNPVRCRRPWRSAGGLARNQTLV